MTAGREMPHARRGSGSTRSARRLTARPLFAALLIFGAVAAGAAELEVDCGVEAPSVWDDEGTGSTAPVTFYLAPARDGFYPVGVTADGQRAGERSTLCLVRDISARADALAAPVDYVRRWWDRGSGARRDGAVWQPDCPTGYSALGFMVRASYRKPDPDAMRCVRDDLTVGGEAKEPHVYKDFGTRAFQDLSVWRLEAIPAEAGFDVGAIFAWDTRNKPTREDGVRLLRASEVKRSN